MLSFAAYWSLCLPKFLLVSYSMADVSGNP